ncbi:MAG: hypothetical protein AAB362_03315 [Patescibacteria group bacterium]
MHATKTVEIEARCKVKNQTDLFTIFNSLDSAPCFPGVHGNVHERNLVYVDAKRPNIAIRLRERIFPNQTAEYSYTEKEKNQSKIIRVKNEKTETLNGVEFRSRVRSCEYQHIRTFVYEREFNPLHYRVFHGVKIEYFLFPFLGSFVEFEIKRGSEKDLKRIMKLFGYRFRDNIQESAKDMAFQFFLKNGELPVRGILFSRKEWSGFCQEYGAKFGTDIKFLEE